MSDSEIIEKVAKLWVELGGDSEGLAWCYRDLMNAVDQILNAPEPSEGGGE